MLYLTRINEIINSLQFYLSSKIRVLFMRIRFTNYFSLTIIYLFWQTLYCLRSSSYREEFSTLLTMMIFNQLPSTRVISDVRNQCGFYTRDAESRSRYRYKRRYRLSARFSAHVATGLLVSIRNSIARGSGGSFYFVSAVIFDEGQIATRVLTARRTIAGGWPLETEVNCAEEERGWENERRKRGLSFEWSAASRFTYVLHLLRSSLSRTSQPLVKPPSPASFSSGFLSELRFAVD